MRGIANLRLETQFLVELLITARGGIQAESLCRSVVFPVFIEIRNPDCDSRLAGGTFVVRNYSEAFEIVGIVYSVDANESVRVGRPLGGIERDSPALALMTEDQQPRS